MAATDVEPHSFSTTCEALCAFLEFKRHHVISAIFAHAFIYRTEDVNVNVLPWGERKHSYSLFVERAFSFDEYLQICPRQRRQILASKLTLL